MHGRFPYQSYRSKSGAGQSGYENPVFKFRLVSLDPGELQPPDSSGPYTDSTKLVQGLKVTGEILGNGETGDHVKGIITSIKKNSDGDVIQVIIRTSDGKKLSLDPDTIEYSTGTPKDYKYPEEPKLPTVLFERYIPTFEEFINT